ncbi:hypothetical protein VKT23_010386 [Stygiomarasmius scandens]|uniref:Uncharacterized protein n=1 Tax=Marasmiellus scandens TaxID=2682957 RepID=A0ABR1JG85_9AGAR
MDKGPFMDVEWPLYDEWVQEFQSNAYVSKTARKAPPPYSSSSIFVRDSTSFIKLELSDLPEGPGLGYRNLRLATTCLVPYSPSLAETIFSSFSINGFLPHPMCEQR